MGRPIVISVLGDTKDLVSKLGQSESRLGRFGRGAAKAGKIAALGIGAAAVAAVGIGVKLVAAGERAGTANARIRQVATSMDLFGARTDAVSNRLVKYANKTALATGMDQNAIKMTQAKLLTFKALAKSADTVGGAFDRATLAAVDMESAGFGSAANNAVQLGKALNDPIKGITALNRSGITFTANQKGVIASLVKTGQSGKAQNIILKAIESQVGGTAKATANGTDRIKVAWSQAAENLGMKLTPAVDKAANYLIDKGLPAAIRFGDGLGQRLSPAVGQARKALSGLSPVVSAAGKTLTGSILPAVTRVGGYLLATFGPVLASVGRIIGGQVLPILGRMGTFLYGTVYPAVVAIAVQVGQRLRPVFDAVAQTVQTNVLPAVQSLMVRFQAAQPTIEKVVGVALKVTGAVLKFGAAILGRVLPPLIRLAGFLLGTAFRAIGLVFSALVKIVGGIIRFGSALASGVRSVLSFANRVDSLIRSLPGRILGALGRAGSLLVSKGRDFISGLIRGVQDKFGAVRTTVGNVIARAKGALSGAGTALLQSGRDLINGLIQGIGERIGAAVDKVRAGLKRIKDMVPGSPIKSGPLKSWNNGGAGKRLIGMLALGLRDTRPVVSAMERVTSAVARTPLGSTVRRPRLALVAGGGLGGAGGGVTVQVTVEVPVGASAVDIGRELQELLDEYARAGGRKRP